MCGAPTQGTAGLEGVDMSRETVIQGRVVADEAPVAAAYVRLLDGSGEFTAEVQTSAEGHFRFFAAPGDWTLRVLSPAGRAEQLIVADLGLTETEVQLA